jgi:hypothetical protein
LIEATPPGILSLAVRAPAWTREELLVAGGAAVALAAAAETARSVYEAFALDLAGLSELERAAVALWDLSPLGAAVFAAGAVALLVGGLRDPVRRLLAFVVSAYVALGLVVLCFAGWVAAAGSVGGRDRLGFRFDGGERVVTLVTQVLGWGPLVALFAVLALRATEEVDLPAPTPSAAGVFEEMEALWRERLAFGPRRERARELLGRIQRLEEAGDAEGARALADEMRRL